MFHYEQVLQEAWTLHFNHWLQYFYLLFLAKIFCQFGATKLKPGRPSLQMSVIQHDPQWSSRKSESFKRTVQHPFLAGEVPRRAQGSLSQMPRREQGPATSKAGTLLSSQPVQPRRRCPSQSIQGSICRGDRSNAVSISGFSSRGSNSLHKKNWQGCPARHSSQERLSLPSHLGTVWLCLLHPRRMWLLSASTQGGGETWEARGALYATIKC